jgi:hypothetical protein
VYIKKTFATLKLHFTLFTDNIFNFNPTFYSKQHQASLDNKSLTMLPNFKLLTFLLATFIQTHLSLAVPVEGPVEATQSHKPRTALHTCAVL